VSAVESSLSSEAMTSPSCAFWAKTGLIRVQNLEYHTRARHIGTNETEAK